MSILLIKIEDFDNNFKLRIANKIIYFFSIE